MKDKEIAIALGKYVGKGEPLLCPVCGVDALDGGQTMMSYGDSENHLFCPHCDLGVELVVFHNPVINMGAKICRELLLFNTENEIQDASSDDGDGHTDIWQSTELSGILDRMKKWADGL